MKFTAVLFGIIAIVVSSVCAKPEDSPANAAVTPEVVISKTPAPAVDPAVNPLDTKTVTSSPASSPAKTTSRPTQTTSTTRLPTTSPTIPPTSQVPPITTTQPTTPTTSTSPSPKPTTSTPPPPAPKPTPKPVPKEYYWNVTNDKAVCILAKADITLKLTYTKETDAGKKEQITQDIKILPNATCSGMCSPDNQVLELTQNKTTIAFNFIHDNSTGDYHLSRISSNITVDHGLGNQSHIYLASDDLKVFKTKLNTSYECRWSEPAVLKEVDKYVNDTKATLRVNMDNIRFEAFKTTSDNDFAQAYACEMDNTDLVPIMVGIALGILVAVVLIAYLVGRRATPTQGYLSM